MDGYTLQRAGPGEPGNSPTALPAPGVVERAMAIGETVANLVGKSCPHLLDELQSEALVAVAEALQSWNPELGVPWEIWVGNVTRWRLRDFQRRWELGPRGTFVLVYPLDGAPRKLQGHEDHHLELLLDQSQVIRQVTSQALEHMPPRARRGVELHLAGMTLAQAGRALGVSEARACQWMADYRASVRNRLLVHDIAS